MATPYATYVEYVTSSGDDTTLEARVVAKLDEVSAELRAECGIADTGALAGDAGTLARKLVIDAAHSVLVPPSLDGFGGDLTGVRQASFTANGFTQSVTVANATGSTRFDSRTLARLKRLLGRGQRMGFVYPYGR